MGEKPALAVLKQRQHLKTARPQKEWNQKSQSSSQKQNFVRWNVSYQQSSHFKTSKDLRGGSTGQGNSFGTSSGGISIAGLPHEVVSMSNSVCPGLMGLLPAGETLPIGGNIPTLCCPGIPGE